MPISSVQNAWFVETGLKIDLPQSENEHVSHTVTMVYER